VNSAALLARMNFALALAQNKVPGAKLDASRFTGDADEVARHILFTNAKPETLAAIAKQTQGSSNTPVVGLVLGSPDFQRR
jgi:type IV secretory pathway TrbL component